MQPQPMFSCPCCQKIFTTSHGLEVRHSGSVWDELFRGGVWAQIELLLGIKCFLTQFLAILTRDSVDLNAVK